jgi:chromate transport protein ChrA
MKYKHVFLIWLFADILLVIGSLVYATKDSLYGTTIFFGSFFGLLFSLPSLIIMLLFHAIYTKHAKNPNNYVLPYSLLILIINIIYLLVGYLWPINYETIYSFYNFYKIFIATTLAGFVSFYLVNRKIKKELKKEENLL